MQDVPPMPLFCLRIALSRFCSTSAPSKQIRSRSKKFSNLDSNPSFQSTLKSSTPSTFSPIPPLLSPLQYTWSLAPPITYFWAFSFTSKIVSFGGITWILILFQTNNYRFYYPFHYPLYSLYVSIHCIHYSCMSLLLHLDYEHLKNNSFIFLLLVPSTLLLYWVRTYM